MTTSTTTDPAEAVEFTTPNGTASGRVDEAAGVIRIFADADVTVEDWHLVCDELRKLGITDPGEPGYDRGVYVWEIEI
jgi:hypothetical protein